MTVSKNMQDLQTVCNFYNVLVQKLHTTKQYNFNNDILIMTMTLLIL